jgi:hypothetical protein
MIWLTWLYAHWKTAAVIAAGIAVWTIIFTAFLKPKDAIAPQPALPVVKAVVVDTSQTAHSAVIESKHEEKRRVKVRVIVPAETVIGGDSAMVIEVVIEDSSKSEAAVEDIKVVDRGLSEAVTIERQEVVPLLEKERLIGVFAGAGYLIPDNDVIPHVGLSLRVYDPVYLCASAGWHDEVIGIGGVAVKVGNLFGMRILIGAGYCSNKQGIVNLTLAF